MPESFRLHLIAIRYGQTPEAVAAWPADVYLEAASYLAYTEPRGPRRE